MSKEVIIGGQRLRAGGKMKETVKSFEKSNHDRSNKWTSTMGVGINYPFLFEQVGAQDTIPIKLSMDMITAPAAGQMIDSYEWAADVFWFPMRLVHALLHMNKDNMKLEEIKFPRMRVRGKKLDFSEGALPVELQQIHPSSLLSYIIGGGIAGADSETYDEQETEIQRWFPAIKLLGYWEINKQYYFNSQEPNAWYIHYTDKTEPTAGIAVTTKNVIGQTDTMPINISLGQKNVTVLPQGSWMWATGILSIGTSVGGAKYIGIDNIRINAIKTIEWDDEENNRQTKSGNLKKYKFEEIFDILELSGGYTDKITIRGQAKEDTEGNGIPGKFASVRWTIQSIELINLDRIETIPELQSFPTENVDEMRMDILAAVRQTSPVDITEETRAPYGTILQKGASGRYATTRPLEGLAVKTYKNDLFNSFINTERITGAEGADELSKIDVTDGYLYIADLQVGRIVYDMFNMIANTQGRYSDYLEQMWDEDSFRGVETPMYLGGMKKIIEFQRLLNQAASEGRPLGELGGTGVIRNSEGNGYIEFHPNEPGYIIGITNITPLISYSQGIPSDNNLKTMADLHKPIMDGIGFQDLITDQMHFADTSVDAEGNVKTFKSMGKQPAFTNLTTAVDRVHGQLAIPDSLMYMTLNRRYEVDQNGLIDATTYIRPDKYNYIFESSNITSENFIARIYIEKKFRLKMSASLMPKR